MERDFRRGEARTQRRMIYLLTAIVGFSNVVLLIVLDLANNPPTLAILALQSAIFLTLGFLVFGALRKINYRSLDMAVLVFGTLVIAQTFLFREFADPDKLSLLGRSLAVIAIGHMLLPTRYIYSALVMTALGFMGLELIVNFYHFAPSDTLALAALMVLVTVVGMLTRWQRERNNRQRFQAARERDEMLAAIRQSELDLRKAKREADEANKAKTDFLAHISHELRTPLNAVIGFSGALESGAAGDLLPKQREFTRDIFNAGEHLLSLINDLLDLSKIEAGKLHMDVEETDILEQVERSLPFVREQAYARNVRLRKVDQTPLPILTADPRMLRQMIVNLLSNAIKFSHQDSEITITTEIAADGRLTLAVTDHGVGIAPADIPKALAPFEQTEAGREAGGTGLGLSLVKSMMELHGGTLELISAVGQGTTVTLNFPVERLAATG